MLNENQVMQRSCVSNNYHAADGGSSASPACRS
jgi:hypothetical protein